MAEKILQRNLEFSAALPMLEIVGLQIDYAAAG
jgi:hypothetical protein